MMFALPVGENLPLPHKPWVTYCLISLCLLVEVISRTAWGNSIGQWAFTPSFLLNSAVTVPYHAPPPWLTLFTSIFMHGGWFHLAGNVLYLWIFGGYVEHCLGKVRFLVFYLSCGVLASLVFAIGNSTSTIPLVGASGAISGVLGGYLLLRPYGEVKMFYWLFFYIGFTLVPAGLILLLWFIQQFLSGITVQDSNIAYSAHIGGFIAGMALVPFMRRKGIPLLPSKDFEYFQSAYHQTNASFNKRSDSNLEPEEEQPEFWHIDVRSIARRAKQRKHSKR